MLSVVKTAPENDAHNMPRILIYRHLAWVNALRLQLRRTTMLDRKNLSFTPDFHLNDNLQCEASLKPFLSETEYNEVLKTANPATQLLAAQGRDLAALKAQHYINDFEHRELLKLIEKAYTYQGQCERIKNFPFPRQYAYFSTVFVWIFVVLLPLGLISEFSRLGYEQAIWLTVPFSTLISWIFVTIEVVGDNSEDPFENYVNDTPMTALCRTIEIDLREMLGEKDLPPRILPVNDILM